MHENAFFFYVFVTFWNTFCYNIYKYDWMQRKEENMGTYNIPRNVKGEGKILFIFSKKSLIYTVIGGGVGLPLYLLCSAFGLKILGIILVVLLALIGFIIGTFKFPEFGGLKFTKKVGGENIDDIIKRAIKFKKKKNKIYLYTKEEEK